MPIDPLINLALNIGMKLVPAAVDQYDKLKKEFQNGGSSSENSRPEPKMVSYRCPKCGVNNNFPQDEHVVLVRCWDCAFVFPVVAGYQKCPCGELWKPSHEQEVARCGRCQTLIATHESTQFRSCNCGNVFREEHPASVWSTECCNTTNSKLHKLRNASLVHPTKCI